MKKILVSVSLALLLPGLAFAASNDVSLNASAVLSVGGITVNVTGTSLVQSITVDGSSISLVMLSGSNAVLQAPGLNQLSVSSATGVTSQVSCSSSISSASITANAAATITVTPSSTLCSSSGGNGNGPVISSGGGGGGGGGYYVPPAPITAPTVTGGSSIEQLQQKIQALLAQIAALGGSAAGSVTFKRDLQIGATGSDAKALQVYLNTHGYVVASSGPGSVGNETTKFGSATKAALVKLQKAAGLTPAAGYFGPKTRAYIAAHP